MPSAETRKRFRRPIYTDSESEDGDGGAAGGDGVSGGGAAVWAPLALSVSDSDDSLGSPLSPAGARSHMIYEERLRVAAAAATAAAATAAAAVAASSTDLDRSRVRPIARLFAPAVGPGRYRTPSRKIIPPRHRGY